MMAGPSRCYVWLSKTSALMPNRRLPFGNVGRLIRTVRASWRDVMRARYGQHGQTQAHSKAQHRSHPGLAVGVGVGVGFGVGVGVGVCVGVAVGVGVGVGVGCTMESMESMEC